MLGTYYALKRGQYDALIMQGVLEHLDEPFVELKWMIDNLVKPDGIVITTSPGFINVRGYVWMTLATLFDIPMSLTDLHFLHPWDFWEFKEKWGYGLDIKCCDIDWGLGNRLIEDFKKRLPKALADGGFPGKEIQVQKLLNFLKNVQNWTEAEGPTAGATIAYKLFR